MSESSKQRDDALTDAFLALARLAAREVNARPELRGVVHTAASWLASATETPPGEAGVEEDEDHAAPLATIEGATDPANTSEIAAGSSRKAESEAVTASDEPTLHRTLRMGGMETKLEVHADPAASIVGPNIVSHNHDPDAPRPASEYADCYTRNTADFQMIIKRASLKAETCRWKVAERRGGRPGEAHGEGVTSTYEQLIERAKALNSCYLWMVQHHTLPPDDTMEIIAGCYDNLALTAELCGRWEDENPAETKPPAELLDLGAEAQSALREALLLASFSDDRDQNDMFHWLRSQAEMHSIYIQRHLRVNDPADPGTWHDLQARLQGYQQFRDAEREADRNREAIRNRIRFHIDQLDDQRFDEQEAHHWSTIVSCIDDWVESHNPSSDRRLSELLIPLLDSIPEEVDLSQNAGQAFEYADRLLTAQEARDRDQPLDRPRLAPDLELVAELLRGKVIVLIGGEAREYAQKRLERDLRVREVRWLNCKPHQSLDTFEPAIKDPDVAAVLLAIRLSSHMHGDLAPICEEYGKPFVRLPRGYGSNEVASQILAQASGKLQEA